MKGMPMSPLMMCAALRAANPKTNTRRLIDDVPEGTESIILHNRQWQAKRKDTEIEGLTLHLGDLRCEYWPGEIRAMLATWAVHKANDDRKPSDINFIGENFWHAGMGPKSDWAGKSRPGRFLPNDGRERRMPKVEILRVEAQRLHDISEVDAIAEGIEQIEHAGQMFWRNYLFETSNPRPGVEITDIKHRLTAFRHPVDSYHSLFDHVYGAGAWAKNPWVWSVHFRRVEK